MNIIFDVKYTYRILLDPDPNFWPDPESMNTDPKHCVPLPGDQILNCAAPAHIEGGGELFSIEASRHHGAWEASRQRPGVPRSFNQSLTIWHKISVMEPELLGVALFKFFAEARSQLSKFRLLKSHK